MLGHYQLDPSGTNFSEILVKNQTFFVQENGFENVVCEIAAILSRGKLINKAFFRWSHNMFDDFQQIIGYFAKSSVMGRWLFMNTLNSLWPSGNIWRQRSGSTLAQVMACCLTAPSHYLNQCWLIISKVQWHLSEGNFTTNTSTMHHLN